jgi:phospholipid transport system transporter-binding protein
MAFAPTTLTLSEAADVVRDGLQALAAGETGIDLGSLKRFDSTAVAALLEWQRAAEAGGATLHVSNVPAGLDSLARLYGVAHLLHR